MRIGVVTTSYPRSADDPAGTFVRGHAHWLVAAGHEVEVVAAGTSASDSWEAPRVRVVRVAASEGLFYSGGAPEALTADRSEWLAAAAFSAALSARVLRMCTRWHAMCAHWLVPAGAAAAIATLSRPGPRVPLLVIAHSGDVHLAARLRCTSGLAALLVAAGAEVVCVSEALREQVLGNTSALLRARLAASTSVSSMGLDTARFGARVERACPSQRPRVLVLGRLVAVKGVEVALEAAARWRSDAELVIAGSGPLESSLRSRAAALGLARVTFVGELRGDERDRMLVAADILLLPSVRLADGRTEGMPVAVLEAMASGAAVVASRVGGLGDVPADAITLVAPGCSDEVASAVDRLLGDGAARAAQQAAASRFVARRDWSVVGPLLTPGKGRRRGI